MKSVTWFPEKSVSKIAGLYSESKAYGWTQNDPVHNQTNDVKHFYYEHNVRDINGNIATPAERLAAIETSRMPQELKDHLRSCNTYAEHVKTGQLRTWLTNIPEAERVRLYNLRGAIEEISDAKLINFSDEFAQLYFDYMKHLGLHDLSLNYYRKAVPVIFLSPSNAAQRLKGNGKLIDRWTNFWENHGIKGEHGIGPKILGEICKDFKGAAKVTKRNLMKLLKVKVKS